MSKKTPSTPASFRALRRYSELSHSHAYETNPHSSALSPSDISVEQATYKKELDAAITDVRRKIMDEELAISQLTSQLPASSNSPETPEQKLRRLRAQKAAYTQSLESVGYVPPPDSPLNILLAYSSVIHTIQGTQASLQHASASLASARANLSQSEMTLKDHVALTNSLRARIESLESESSNSEKESPLTKMASKQSTYAKETARFMRELTSFIDSRLSLLLAAEDMGGPVVGQDMDVKIEKGFDKHGHARKGDRRIDEMWGQGEEKPEVKAAREMKNLLEELMNATVEEGGGWVTLERDYAAARFLVRAKVAEFHPRDAKRMRLVEFGREVEDG
ncbi:hypothetical protein RUND412_005779 [Rhizina undulata]